MLKASAAAAQASVAALLAAGLERDDDLLTVRKDQAISDGRAEARRQLETVASQVEELREVARQGAWS